MEARIRIINEFGNERRRRRQGDESKIYVFLYLIGGQGREIYDTMAFAVPASQRTLAQV